MFTPFLLTASPPPTVYTWCVFQMIQTKTKEMISAPYGMGNVPAGVDVQNLCRAFYTRDIRAEDKPLELILTTGIQNTSNPDTFWLANTWRRPLTQAELEQYACLFSQHSEGLLTVATTNAISLMPKSPDSIRVPALIISALSVTNSPILRFAIVVCYNTVLPIFLIGGLVKAWRLLRK